MLSWLHNNLGTVAVCVGLAILLGAVAIHMIKEKKQGKSSCGCGCEGCALSEQCHPQKKKD